MFMYVYAVLLVVYAFTEIVSRLYELQSKFLLYRAMYATHIINFKGITTHIYPSVILKTMSLIVILVFLLFFTSHPLIGMLRVPISSISNISNINMHLKNPQKLQIP